MQSKLFTMFAVCMMLVTLSATAVQAGPGDPELKLFSDTFQRVKNWQPVRGQWQVKDGVYQQMDAHRWTLHSVTGSSDWRDYAVEVDVRADGVGEEIGLYARYQDVGNTYVFVWNRRLKNVRLRKIKRGRWANLAAVPYEPYQVGEMYRLKFSLEGDQLRGFINGEQVVAVTDDTFTTGKVALFASQQKVTFDNVLVTSGKSGHVDNWEPALPTPTIPPSTEQLPHHPSTPNQPVSSGLSILPENPRYFQYQGLPFVAFGYNGGLKAIPDAYDFTRRDIEKAAEIGNHIYLYAFGRNVRTTFVQLLDRLNDETYWRQLENVCGWAEDEGVMVSLIFWNYWWNFGEQKGRTEGAHPGSDMLRRSGHPLLMEDLGKYDSLLKGWTRMKIHQLAIDNVVEHTWHCRNVTYAFMWEYRNLAVVGSEFDGDGGFHRQWVKMMKDAGQKIDPNIAHLFSLHNDLDKPQQRSADFVVLEGGITRRPRSGKIQPWRMPLVHWAIGQEVNPNTTGNGNTGPATPDWVREKILSGFQPSENFPHVNQNTKKLEPGLTPETRDYFLQARWYLENIKTWGNEDFQGGVSINAGRGDEINQRALPMYRRSKRPTLKSVAGYTNGAKASNGKMDFAVTFTDPEGQPPAQAEVWVDRNNDGRFHPNPAKGERIAMKASSAAYKAGARFTAEGISITDRQARYVFRFADSAWYPPRGSVGVMLDNWYDSYVIIVR